MGRERERGREGREKGNNKERREREEGEINNFMVLYVLLPKLHSEFQVPDSLF